MEKVVDLRDRLEDKKRKRQVEIHRHKSETVQRMVQCASCQFRCAMCGHHMRQNESSYLSPPSPVDWNLCQTCRAEFEDYLKISRGTRGSALFWHNREWLKLWAAWLDYQKAIREFRHSDEFRQLLEEIEDIDD